MGGVTALATNGYEYSLYGAQTFDKVNGDYFFLNQIEKDIYLGRGAIHEWTHQIMNNIYKGGELGNKHTNDETLPKRYEQVQISSRENIMVSGSAWTPQKKPTIQEPLFTYLPIDNEILILLLNNYIPKLNSQLLSFSFAKTNRKQSHGK